MKRINIILLIALVAIVIVLSIFGQVGVTLYSQNTNLKSYWTQHTSSSGSLLYTSNNHSSEVGVSAIVTSHTRQTDLGIKIDELSDFKADIDKEINIGFSRFIPLVKRVKFNSKFKVHWSGKLQKDHELILLSNSGSFVINGKTKILGLCSAKKTNEMIRKKIMDQARKMITDDVKKKVEEL